MLGAAISKAGATNNQAQSGMPAYGYKTVSPTANRYTPTYAPMQQSSMQQSSMQQSPMQQTPQQNLQNMGLEALYQSMASQFAPISQQQNPMDQFYQGPMQQGRQMPTYQSQALNYRPNMSGITSNLNRVAPSVVLQQRQAAEAEAKRLAEEAANAPPSPTYTYDQPGG
jgi:hypothetical protein